MDRPRRRGKSGPAPVPAAPDPASTPATDTPKASKRTNPKGWPKYTEAEQHLLREFLMAYGLSAARAIEKAKEMDAAAPGNEVIAGTIRYWSNVLSGIDWMLGKLGQRQRAVQLLRDELAAREAG